MYFYSGGMQRRSKRIKASSGIRRRSVSKENAGLGELANVLALHEEHGYNGSDGFSVKLESLEKLGSYPSSRAIKPRTVPTVLPRLPVQQSIAATTRYE